MAIARRMSIVGDGDQVHLGADCGTTQSGVTQLSGTGTACAQTHQCLTYDGDYAAKLTCLETLGQVHLRRRFGNDTVRCNGATVEHGQRAH